MSKREISLIVAVSAIDGAIGKDNKLPWGHIPNDIRRFKKLTYGHAVIMGRKTWDSLPTQPLPNRMNIIISHHDYSSTINNIKWVKSLREALDASLTYEKVFIIGGASLYHESLPLCTNVHYTVITPLRPIEMSFLKNCDAFFIFHSKKEFKKGTTIKEHLDDYDISYTEYKRIKNVEEIQYFNLIENIMLHGNSKDDRTGVGTYSLFGQSMRFRLRHGIIPLLTSKKMFWKGIAEELLWFISGNTSAKPLQDKGIHIWDGNSSRDFLDKNGFTEREVGDLGPVYGFQWRHFGAKYGTCNDDYKGQGIDQLADVIHKIKHNPNDRRIILSAWNPTDLSEMVLPPCHMMAQFYVNNGELSCQMYQRSADCGLGVPFNIASYALLTHIIAHCCQLQAGELIHVMGDTHIYKNHVQALNEQVHRHTTIFPRIQIKDDIRDIDAIRMEHITLMDYFPTGKAISMEMAV